MSDLVDASKSTTSVEPATKKLKLDAPDLEEDVRIHEYMSAANPDLLQVPVKVHHSKLHESGPTRVIPFDLSEYMKIPYPASSPNLIVSFLRICENETLDTKAQATSQAFYVIRGAGSSSSEHGEVEWSKGDLFVLPATEKAIVHTATDDAALYWVNDEPLLQYLGVRPSEARFKTTVFRQQRMLDEVERISHQPGAEHKNRMGILLGNKITEDGTKTLTHTLWSLLNVLPAGDHQRPHRHNSVAFDLCVSAAAGDKVYTLMGTELDENGWVKNPVKCLWKSGTVFSTPPGWWHSHHNETGEPAWVLPMQDAGLYTHQRTLDIQFSIAEGTGRQYKVPPHIPQTETSKPKTPLPSTTTSSVAAN